MGAAAAATTNWSHVVEAYSDVTKENIRSLTVECLDLFCEDIKRENVNGITKIYEKRNEMIRQQNETTKLIIDNLTLVEEINEQAVMITGVLDFGYHRYRSGDWAQLQALKSSLSTEMPTSGGVFGVDTKQPYLSEKLETKLKVSRKRVEVVKENKPEVKVEEVEKVEIVEKKPKKIFKAKNIVVSESLRNKKLAGKSKSMNEMLIALGATPVPHVGTFTKNTFLICSIKDYKRQSGVYRDAKTKRYQL